MSSGGAAPPEPPPLSDKGAWRRWLRQRRDGVPPPDRAVRSVAASQHLIASGLLEGAKLVAGYAAFRSEADPRSALDAHRARGGHVAFPRVDGDRLRWFISAPEALRPTPPWWIPEPVPEASQPVNPERFDAWIVPGLGFTQDGLRLGYGRGHYDRALEETGARLTIGFAFDAQVVEALPSEPHDRRVAAIVTGSGVVRAFGDAL